MMHVINVPGFAGIRIHSGNTADDSEGCLITGRTRRPNWVGESKLALLPLFQKVKAAVDRREPVTIEITHVKEKL